MKNFFTFIIIFTCFINAAFLAAEEQRMAIKIGDYKIPANTSKRVEARCMDFTRAQPNSMTIYKYILNNTANAVVRTAGQEINLKTAIEKGIIKITGIKLSLEEFIENVRKSLTDVNVPQEVIGQNKLLLDLWENAKEEDKKNLNTLINLSNCIDSKFIPPPKETNHPLYPVFKSWAFLPDSVKNHFNIIYDHFLKQIRQQIREQIDSYRDFSSLEMINLTDEDIEIKIDDDLILSVEDEDIDCLMNIMAGHSLEDQLEIWRIQNMARLKILSDLGCVDKSIKDNSKMLTAAVICFQQKNDIKPTGIIDKETEKLLCKEYMSKK